MDLVIFEENKPLVLQALNNGEFDYLESASEVFEADFFRFIKSKTILDKLAKTYPTPRKKEDVPLWFYLSSNLSMRLHGANAFNVFPMIIRVGGMLNAFGPDMGKKVVHPDTKDITVTCEGFNNKNNYDRETPCDQDFLRKMAKDTDADKLMDWFSNDAASIFRKSRVFDKEGIFIGDASYLFVPDNPKYENSVKLLFDENNHPINKKRYENLPSAKKALCEWKRCYKMVTLLHTNRNQNFFLVLSVKIVPGNDHESPILYEQVDRFVEKIGKGVIKRLILDRGFLDGASISKCKKDHKIDVLIPIKRNMDIYKDAQSLFQLPDVQWIEWKESKEEKIELVRPKPNIIIQREKKRQETLQEKKLKEPAPPPEKVIIKKESASISGFNTWSSCTVPLNVVANRETYADGHEDLWFLIDTRQVENPVEVRKEYLLRTAIEERYRQFKCFCNLTKFKSRAFSMVVNQVVFIFLAYNLLQIFLLRKKRENLNTHTFPDIRGQVMPATNYIIIYWKHYFGLFDPLELVGIISSLNENAREKITKKTNKLRTELKGMLGSPRAP